MVHAIYRYQGGDGEDRCDGRGYSLDTIFTAKMKPETAMALLTDWHKAVGRTMNWAMDSEI